MTYRETLKTVNDALEIGTINKLSPPVETMKGVMLSLSPICTSDIPPDGVERDSIQEMLDRELIRLIKIQKDIPL